ncbi:MAG: hypothetical protein LC437_01485 [Thiohalomonas sp.]|nr:hypothetical protein [Thiohalomonas sp.]
MKMLDFHRSWVYTSSNLGIIRFLFNYNNNFVKTPGNTKMKIHESYNLINGNVNDSRKTLTGLQILKKQDPFMIS